MNRARNNSGSDAPQITFLLVLLPLVSLVILLSAGTAPAPASNAVAPPAATIQSQSSQAVKTPMPQAQTTTANPTNAAGAQAANSTGPTIAPTDSNSHFLQLYGEHIYPNLQSMHADMLTWYLTWVRRVAVYFDVPEEDILAVHYAELMGNGFNPLESRISSARAAGPGQIIPQTWNGWSCGSHQTTFLTDPAKITACGGIGTDFDGDGVADVSSLPDNLAATARHLKNDGISNALRANTQLHESALRDALAKYNSNKTYQQAPSITRTYADIGVRWWKETGPLMYVYYQVYAPNA